MLAFRLIIRCECDSLFRFSLEALLAHSHPACGRRDPRNGVQLARMVKPRVPLRHSRGENRRGMEYTLELRARHHRMRQPDARLQSGCTRRHGGMRVLRPRDRVVAGWPPRADFITVVLKVGGVKKDQIFRSGAILTHNVVLLDPMRGD